MTDATLGRPSRLALVGNPNSGKTALFNALTGSRQKVANYAGVTVERKEGTVTTADGRVLSVLDLPGTYSLRARSPDEAVTRDAVLGRLVGETPPDVIICVADATNLRLVLRLILELKQVGRPMVLALNMYDIAQRQGLRIDLEGLKADLGIPIVTTVATRKRGIEDLVAQADALAGDKITTESAWREPSAAEIRHAHREAQRVMKAYVKAPERPDTFTGKLDAVLLHPVAGILILFFFIILLEDFGYMARAAFLMDKIMGGAGLHGRAFIPLLSSFACAIPGIMSTRVIDNKRDRLTTILVAPLMTCSARIPVYTLIIAAFIPHTTVAGFLSLPGLVMFGLYASGIVSALAVSFVIRSVFWRGRVEPFMMELPTYKAPDPKNVARNVLLRGQIFLKRAGTTILGMMVLIWILSTIPGPPPGATGPAIDYSFAGMIGHFMEPVMAPIGFNWQMSVALIPGMAAREVAVAALGTVYAIGGSGDAATASLGSALAHQWSLASALAFLAWYVFAPQCAATLGVVKRETNSWRWPIVMFVYMTALAYGAAFIVYHLAVMAGLGVAP